MFVLGKLAWYPAAPGNLLVLLLVAGFVALLLRRYRVAAALTGAASVGAMVVLLTPVAQLALAPLEDRFPQPSLPAHIDGMVVLGGAVDVNVSRARGQPAVNDAAERIVAAAALRGAIRMPRSSCRAGRAGWNMAPKPVQRVRSWCRSASRPIGSCWKHDPAIPSRMRRTVSPWCIPRPGRCGC